MLDESIDLLTRIFNIEFKDNLENEVNNEKDLKNIIDFMKIDIDYRNQIKKSLTDICDLIDDEISSLVADSIFLHDGFKYKKFWGND